MTAINLNELRKSYGATEVIHGVDLDIHDGEFVVFVGPSGCGKSTMLRMIAGLEEITSGDLSIDGQKMNDETPTARGISMVFQSYALYPNMTVRQNLSFGLEQIKMPKDEISKRVDDVAELLQITPLLKRRPGELSGGQSQRVAIGRAIVRDPKIFLFDEPLSNLDAELRVHMRVEIKALHARLKRTTVYVTHDQVEAMTMADRIVVFRSGVIEQVGTPLELYNAPANRFVAGFIGSPQMNFVNAGLRVDKRITFTAETGESVIAGLRPEHITLGEAGTCLFDCEVQLVEQLGGEAFIYLRNPASDEKLVVKSVGQTCPAVGDVVGVDIAEKNIYLFDLQSDLCLKSHHVSEA